MIEILSLCLFSSIFGTFVDSLLGSLLEESWWCASKKRILSHSSVLPDCCSVAKREKKRVCGHSPSTCGLVSGHMLCSGNAVNLLSSSVTSLFVFWYVYAFGFKGLCVFWNKRGYFSLNFCYETEVTQL